VTGVLIVQTRRYAAWFCPDTMSSDAQSAAAQLLWVTIEENYWSTFIPGIVYGIYCVFAVVSMCILAQQGISGSWTNIFMFSTILVMFVSASLVEAIQYWFSLIGTQIVVFPDLLTDALNNKINDITVFAAVLTRINYFLGDAVVVWRAWVIWGRQKPVLLTLAALLLGSFAAAVVDLSLSMSELLDGDDVDNDSAIKLGERSMVLTLPLLTTNIVSSILIMVKAWEHRRFIKSDLSGGSAADRVANILIWILETAALYCFIWLFYLLASFKFFSEITFDVMDSLMFMVAGVYPTIIIILVSINRSQVDRYLSAYKESVSMRFSSVWTA